VCDFSVRRDNCFDTTLVHLTERFNGKDVYLIGSANSSTMLAQRTQKLIEEIKPDQVLVQTSPAWWDNARMLKYVDSQAEMD
jgi:pheromone shutdown protein TraB